MTDFLKFSFCCVACLERINYFKKNMRPNSRGNLGSSGGPPPGTGMRPGSGVRKPPGTGRLRTGAPSSTAGHEAGQGFALNTAVNVSERPVTGQGVMGMKAQGSGTGRIVTDAAYYIGLLRKKIGDTSTETIKLRTEIDQSSRDSTQYVQLERKYEGLIKNKELLEGQLADYNLALDKVINFISYHPSKLHILSAPFRHALLLIRKMCSRWLCT